MCVLTFPLCFAATTALGSREAISESGVPIDPSLQDEGTKHPGRE